jgi:hypothetical protein
MRIRLAGYIIAALAALWAIWFVYDLLTASGKVKGRLGENQTEAALESGKDAVSTVGAQGKTESDREKSVAKMKDKVNESQDTAGAHAAGANFLCLDFGICPEE